MKFIVSEHWRVSAIIHHPLWQAQLYPELCRQQVLTETWQRATDNCKPRSSSCLALLWSHGRGSPSPPQYSKWYLICTAFGKWKTTPRKWDNPSQTWKLCFVLTWYKCAGFYRFYVSAKSHYATLTVSHLTARRSRQSVWQESLKNTTMWKPCCHGCLYVCYVELGGSRL